MTEPSNSDKHNSRVVSLSLAVKRALKKSSAIEDVLQKLKQSISTANADEISKQLDELDKHIDDYSKIITETDLAQ